MGFNQERDGNDVSKNVHPVHVAIQAANGLGWVQFQWFGFATWSHLVWWQMG
jgi:hypothetical protein